MRRTGISKFFRQQLCKLKDRWNDLIKEIISGECACHKACTLVYCTTETDDCGDEQLDTPGGFFGLNGGGIGPRQTDHTCPPKKYEENLQLAVFYKPKTWLKEDRKFVYPEGTAETIVTRANMEKLIKVDSLIIDTTLPIDVNNTYTRMTNPEGIGFGGISEADDCDGSTQTVEYFSIKWELC